MEQSTREKWGDLQSVQHCQCSTHAPSFTSSSGLSGLNTRGFISHYTVAYTPLTSNGRNRQALDNMTVTVHGMDANTTRIEGLDPNTDYTVQVSATNGAGTSTLSQEFLAATPLEGTQA